MKQKTCKACRCKFTPSRPLQAVCGPECAIVLANRKRMKKQHDKDKAERKATMARKEAVKTRRDYIKEAQIAFNAFIRFRDRNRPCICCGLPLGSESIGGVYDCGHYRSVGSAPHLRFDERNAHAQRKQCNRWGSGRAVDYRIGLIQRVGLDIVIALEEDNEQKHWSIDDLKQIRDQYKAKLKALMAERKKNGP